MNGLRSPDVASTQTLALLVDALVWPLLLLRLDGRLLHANAAALQALTTQRHLLLGPQQRLQPADGQRSEEWLAVIDAARAGQRRLMHWPGGDGCTATVMPLAMPRAAPSGGDTGPVLLVALGMASSHPLADPGTAASPDFDADTSAYAKAHHLTRAEARVLQRLALGDSPTQAATALHVTVATVRSQAASIRRKTGHDSTATLVSAATRSSPIWPDHSAQPVSPTTASAAPHPEEQ